jgi:hypothetical protein
MISNCSINDFCFNNSKTISKKNITKNKKSDYERLVINSINKSINSWSKDIEYDI